MWPKVLTEIVVALAEGAQRLRGRKRRRSGLGPPAAPRTGEERAQQSAHFHENHGQPDRQEYQGLVLRPLLEHVQASL